MSRRREGALFHAILLLQLASVPQADVRAAERLAHQSLRDYDLGEYDAALQEAEQAYRLDPLPELLFNIGQCHRALQHWEKALFFYRRYLKKLPNASNAKEVAVLMAELEKLSAQTQKVSSAPPQPGKEPLPATAAAPTAAPPAPAAPSPVAETPEAGPPTASAAAAAPPAAVEVSVGPPAEPHHSHVLGICLVVGGVVAGGIAGFGQYEVQTFLSDRSIAQGPTTGTYPHLYSEQQTAQNWLWPSIVLGVLGVASVTVGIVEW